MKWIILIGDEGFNLELIRNINHVDSLRTANINPNRFVVDYGNEHIFYDYVDDLINDYEDGQLSCIPFSTLKFIMMVYTSDELMKKVFMQENYLKGIYVDDDDNGIILPIEKFIKQL